MCSRCKINQTRSPKQSTCSGCHNEYQKNYYKQHPASINKSAYARKEKIRLLIIEKKDVPCADCEIKYPYYVMDFDHKKDKRFNLSIAAVKHIGIEKVIEEINKCEVVCANCHRIRTFNK